MLQIVTLHDCRTPEVLLKHADVDGRAEQYKSEVLRWAKQLAEPHEEEVAVVVAFVDLILEIMHHKKIKSD